MRPRRRAGPSPRPRMTTQSPDPERAHRSGGRRSDPGENSWTGKEPERELEAGEKPSEEL
jgi:hypothetical protein